MNDGKASNTGPLPLYVIPQRSVGVSSQIFAGASHVSRFAHRLSTIAGPALPSRLSIPSRRKTRRRKGDTPSLFFSSVCRSAVSRRGELKRNKAGLLHGQGKAAANLGVDFTWISHVSMEQGKPMSTYLRCLGSTHL